MEPALAELYTRAAYVVADRRLQTVLRIGTANRAVAAWMQRHQTPLSAFITAHNPRSTRQSAEKNRRAHARLLARVAGFPFLHGFGCGDDGGWPAERSLLVAAPSEAVVCDWLAEFGQHAAVVVGTDGMPRLVWAQN